MKIMLWFVNAALLLASTGAIACQSPIGKGDRALIVGIGNYPLGENLRLAGPGEDRRAIRELLQTQLGFSADSICELQDGEATEARIRTAFEQWLIGGTAKGHRAFFYFSGHGGRLSLSEDLHEADGLDEVLIAADVQMQGSRPTAGYIADNQIKLWLDQLSDRQTSLVVDSCFAGTIYRSATLPSGHELTRSLRLRPSSAAPPLKRSAADTGLLSTLTANGGAGLTVWMASSEGELAFDAPAGAPTHGQFTRAWIAQVKANVSQQQALANLRREAHEYCASLPKTLCSSLTPQLHTAGQNLGRSLVATLQSGARLVPEAAQAALHALPSSDIAVQVSLKTVGGKVLNENSGGRVGSPVVLSITSNRRGYVYRYVMEQGRLKQLCVKDASKKEQCAPIIEPGKTRKEQLVLDKSGEALLLIVVSEQPFSLRTSQKTRAIKIVHEDGTSVQTDASVVSESQSQEAFTALTQELLQQSLPQADSQQQRYGLATIRFDIKDQGP